MTTIAADAAIDTQYEQSAVRALLASITTASTRQVIEALTECRPDDVRLLDAPTADALDVALDLAKADRRPTVDVLNAELLRRGMYAGHSGDRLRSRLLDVASPSGDAWLLPEHAASVLSLVWRAKLAAWAEALADAAPTAPESDLWQLVVREGAAVREIRERLARTRGENA